MNSRSDKIIHVSIHARDTRIRDTFRQRRQPSLRLPLRSIWSPDFDARVDRLDTDHGGRTLGDDDFGQVPAVVTRDRSAEW